MGINKAQKPTWNLHDKSPYNPEWELFESVLVEYNDIQGFEVEYYQVKSNVKEVNMDILYGEDPLMDWKAPKITKVTYEVAEEMSYVEIFGMSTNESNVEVQIPIFTFHRDVDPDPSVTPMPGDLIRFRNYANTGYTGSDPSYTNLEYTYGRFYEISGILTMEHVTFNAKKFVWKLPLRVFQFAEQSETIQDMTIAHPVSAWGDNDWIESQSDTIEDYSDVDSSIYGY